MHLVDAVGRELDDDFVGVVLDTFNDQRRAFEFFTNPLGVQMDLTYDDVNGNEDDSWDAIWESAGVIGELAPQRQVGVVGAALDVVPDHRVHELSAAPRVTRRSRSSSIAV